MAFSKESETGPSSLSRNTGFLAIREGLFYMLPHELKSDVSNRVATEWRCLFLTDRAAELKRFLDDGRPCIQLGVV